MYRNFIIAIYLLMLTPQAFCLRGALFRSGRSFRFLQPNVIVDEDAPVESKRDVALIPLLPAEEQGKRQYWQPLSS
ncbi:hypothetical protein KIN20_029119 [Parelaphostrongylus tenuis]|uniref:Uncharacterized protein n=1 Tax=Parelaphostrongylus tenuis TaxID=148309 RepID=A0AAD5WFC7_PARTN|nr:hypothetical protein KIN20_029119 [Parelaphostrongylus tenuis]